MRCPFIISYNFWWIYNYLEIKSLILKHFKNFLLFLGLSPIFWNSLLSVFFFWFILVSVFHIENFLPTFDNLRYLKLKHWKGGWKHEQSFRAFRPLFRKIRLLVLAEYLWMPIQEDDLNCLSGGLFGISG